MPLTDENVVFPLDEGDEVSCYFCRGNFGRGQAFLAGAGHSPLDGNANYVCRDHLDTDAVIWDGYEYKMVKPGHVLEGPLVVSVVLQGPAVEPVVRVEVEKKAAKVDSFWKWLMKQRKRDDPVGDVARDAYAERHKYSGGLASAFVLHVENHPHACEEAVVAARRAGFEYGTMFRAAIKRGGVDQ